MNFAKSERQELCLDLLRLGPAAATLCAGWQTHDLAAHLWLRETDPLAAPGMALKPLTSITERRMTELKAKWPYHELVHKLSQGPAPYSVFALPGVDDAANTLEYFVHREDVLRAQPDFVVRSLDRSVETWFWKRLKLMARAFYRRAPVGVLLERSDLDDHDPEIITAMPGSDIVTIHAKPSEHILFAYGRGNNATVSLIGQDQAVAQLVAADFSV